MAMELKDLVLSTISEFDQEIVEKSDEEIEFLKHSKERLVTLFEALKAPNSKKLEAKLSLTLDYLEHSLKSIDNRIETLSCADAK